MFVVIEGVNGVGKTTLSKGLKESLGLRELRPFRKFRDGHWGNNSRGSEVLEQLRVPFNSAIEDLFMADFVAELTDVPVLEHFITDRSLPSGLAYDGEAFMPKYAADQRRLAYDVWLKLLEGVDVRYIWMTADPEIAQARTAPERRNIQWDRVVGVLAEAYALIPWPKITIDTTHAASEDVFSIARHWLTSGIG